MKQLLGHKLSTSSLTILLPFLHSHAKAQVFTASKVLFSYTWSPVLLSLMATFLLTPESQRFFLYY
jgi:hypothetical protein